MLDFRSTAKFLGAFGAGVVTAGFFLSAPIERPAVLQHSPDFASQGASEDAGWVLVPPAMPYAQPLTPPPAVTNPSVAQQEPSPLAAPDQARSNVTTVGSGAGAATHQPTSRSDPSDQSAGSRQVEPSCNYALCRRHYRSFDEATCTYQPYRGPRELCTR
jgi:hypothetical protein